MNTPLTDIEVDKFNALYEKGCELQKSLVILDNAPSKKPGFNIGLSYLMTGKIEEAKASFSRAARAEPGNTMNKNLLKLVDSVADGKVACPRSVNEILKLI